MDGNQSDVRSGHLRTAVIGVSRFSKEFEECRNHHSIHVVGLDVQT